ncbi:hypothetical protein AND_002519 [Anopheles darlingi]|uniref:Chitin-binding type-2 domain-containing protein n=1 Tax=Anopheles darlingi TaxID=43151 RepID=W5JQW9_ANODA|nr:hypothetical protein AND_002519 [Anopheles darlingi]
MSQQIVCTVRRNTIKRCTGPSVASFILEADEERSQAPDTTNKSSAQSRTHLPRYRISGELTMNVFQALLLAVTLCSVAAQKSFSFEDGIPDLRCPQYDNPTKPIHLAHPTDCGKFQKCFSGRAFTISCPPGQEFGVQIQRCDYPSFAKCRQGMVLAKPEPAEFSYDLGSTDSRCPRFDDPLRPAHLPHPTDCQRFYKCFAGRAFELQCPPGQEWATTLNRCEFPFVAKCNARRNDEVAAREEQLVELEQTEEQEAVEEPQQQEEEEEEKKKEVAQEEGFVLPAKAEFTYNAGIIDARCPKYDDPYRPIHLAHPTDCRKFQKCFDGRAYTIDCPVGQEFGARINRCDYPQFAQCSMQRLGKASLAKKAAVPIYDDYYDDEDYKESIPLDSTEWTPEQREMIAGINDSRCPDKDDPTDPVHFIHPKDCSKFYKCYDGRAYLIYCPLGQHWSVRYDRCDYPKVAKCTIRGG